MNAVLSIFCEELSEEAIQKLTFDISKTLNQETDLNADIAEVSGKSGQKGDVITVGQIILTALTSGTVIAMLNVIRSYIEQNNSLKMSVQRKDGAKLTFAGENLNKAQYDKTLATAKDFFEG